MPRHATTGPAVSNSAKDQRERVLWVWEGIGKEIISVVVVEGKRKGNNQICQWHEKWEGYGKELRNTVSVERKWEGNGVCPIGGIVWGSLPEKIECSLADDKKCLNFYNTNFICRRSKKVAPMGDFSLTDTPSKTHKVLILKLLSIQNHSLHCIGYKVKFQS